MIAKIQPHRSGFMRTAQYVMGKDRADSIATTFRSLDEKVMRAQAAEVRQLRPRLQKAAWHASLNLAPGETLSQGQWREVVSRYMDGMGFEHSPWVAVRHRDRDHEHVHVVALRINVTTGKTVSADFDWERSAKLVQQLEQDYGLQRATRTPAEARELGQRPMKPRERQEVDRRRSKGEIGPAPREGVWRAVREVLEPGTVKTLPGFIKHLAERGVEVTPNLQSTGRLAGLRYSADGRSWKASELGKAYGVKGLAKVGVTYDVERDGPALGLEPKVVPAPAERARALDMQTGGPPPPPPPSPARRTVTRADRTAARHAQRVLDALQPAVVHVHAGKEARALSPGRTTQFLPGLVAASREGMGVTFALEPSSGTHYGVSQTLAQRAEVCVAVGGVLYAIHHVSEDNPLERLRLMAHGVELLDRQPLVLPGFPGKAGEPARIAPIPFRADPTLPPAPFATTTLESLQALRATELQVLDARERLLARLTGRDMEAALPALHALTQRQPLHVALVPPPGHRYESSKQVDGSAVLVLSDGRGGHREAVYLRSCDPSENRVATPIPVPGVSSRADRAVVLERAGQRHELFGRERDDRGPSR